MAIRQYIGARYVLKIYENSLNPQSADWEANTYYEPLTMVNYNYSSYISRKDVPANIGNPVDNPTYWALSGLYNGQIATLQNEIDAINAILTDVTQDISLMVKPHRVVFIADSYGSVQSSALPINLASTLGLTIDTDFFYHCEGGSGFIGNGIARTFKQQFQELENDILYPEHITDIIVGGGINDNSSTLYTIMSAVSDFISYVKTVCPNAQVHVGYFSKSTDHNAIWGHYNSTLQAYKNGAMAYGGSFIEQSPAFLDYQDLDVDGLHPTETGCKHLAWNLSNYLNDGEGVWQTIDNNPSATFDQTDITSNYPLSVKFAKLHNGNWFVQVGEALASLANATGNFFQNGKKIASFSQKYVDAVDYNIGSIPITLFARYVDSNNNTIWRAVPASFMIKLDGVYLKYHSDYENNNYAMTGFYIQPFNATIDSFTC